jgi:hypothetical protein
MNNNFKTKIYNLLKLNKKNHNIAKRFRLKHIEKKNLNLYVRI